MINDSQEVIISRGSESAVLIPLDQFNSIKETEYLMSSKEMEKVILQGMEDVKNGNYREVDINELKDCIHASGLRRFQLLERDKPEDG